MSSNFNPQFSKLGEILIHNGKATESGVNEALAEQKVTNEKIGAIHSEEKPINEIIYILFSTVDFFLILFLLRQAYNSHHVLHKPWKQV